MSARKSRKEIIRISKEFDKAYEEGRLLEKMVNFFQCPTYLHVIWELREYFHKLSTDEIRTSEEICAVRSVLAAMEGKLEEAMTYHNYLPDDCKFKEYNHMVMPCITNEEFFESMHAIKNANMPPNEAFSISAGRLSLINGFRDFTEYGNKWQEIKEHIIEAVHVVYGEAAVGVYEIAFAELLYQRNKCLDALVMAIRTIPFMEKMNDRRCLFVALALQFKILVMNGQISSSGAFVEGLRKKVHEEGCDELEQNVDAMEVWASMYEGDYEKISQWMEFEAPDEFEVINMLDTFRYMVKLRGYLACGKYMSVVNLVQTLKPILEAGHRNMDMCEINLLLAIALFEYGEKAGAFTVLDQTLDVAEKYRYDRLIGDEGEKMYHLLSAYEKSRGKSEYLTSVIEIAKKTGIMFPKYLKMQKDEYPTLTEMEINILNLMKDARTNNEIGEYLNISLNTVKFHTKNIFQKLSVKNRTQAVKEAIEIGIINL